MSPADVRILELHETLQIVTSHANHMISNMSEMLEHDARFNSPEWQQKSKSWVAAWLHAQEVITPGITGNGRPT